MEPLFEYEDVVKIRYYKSSKIWGGRGVVNETAYRIIDVIPVDRLGNHIETDLIVDTRSSSDIMVFGYEYVLDGLINGCFVQQSEDETKDYIACYITRANHYPVQYAARVEGNGNEYNYNVGYDNYTILQDYFKFNTS